MTPKTCIQLCCIFGQLNMLFAGIMIGQENYGFVLLNIISGAACNAVCIKELLK